jgi:ubiquinol-cytochrome c reductase cytochrome b subunit
VRRGVLDWLHERTGFRTGLSHLLDEPVPPGTGWWFTLGSLLVFLLAVQALTGIALSLYYAPTPDSAYQSVEYITRDVPLGRFVRGLHYFAASGMVIVAVLHLLRVVFFGSYKAPREITWLTGIALLLVVLAFALTGYLLPWDQRAYWATVVTVNIARLAPFVGEVLATAAGASGGRVGALTLSRWFAMHAIVLPALVVTLVAAHLFLMRRHGISGPLRPRSGESRPFYPYQAARDVTVMLVVGAVLAVLAWRGLPALEPMADPADAGYVPRPEWYFLPLFQLLTIVPGRLEIVAALVVPALAVALLALLPWIDRGPERDPRRRRGVVTMVGAGVVAIGVLTVAAWRDRPARAEPGTWTIRETAGAVLAESMTCGRCHDEGKVADRLPELPNRRPVSWIRSHVADPEMIAPGIRPASEVEERDVAAIVAFLRRPDGEPDPPGDPIVRRASVIFARHCIGCHVLDGDGGTEGPDLSRTGREHDGEWLRRWIANPERTKPDAEMPAFEAKLPPEDIAAVAALLANRR